MLNIKAVPDITEIFLDIDSPRVGPEDYKCKCKK